MISLALIGAGGKMGCRLTDNFLKSAYKLHYLEVSPKGIENLRRRGVALAQPGIAVREADVDGPLQLQICSLDYSSFVSRIGVGRVARNPDARARVLAMRAAMHDNAEHLQACVVTATRRSAA